MRKMVFAVLAFVAAGCAQGTENFTNVKSSQTLSADASFTLSEEISAQLYHNLRADEEVVFHISDVLFQKTLHVSLHCDYTVKDDHKPSRHDCRMYSLEDEGSFRYPNIRILGDESLASVAKEIMSKMPTPPIQRYRQVFQRERVTLICQQRRSGYRCKFIMSPPMYSTLKDTTCDAHFPANAQTLHFIDDTHVEVDFETVTLPHERTQILKYSIQGDRLTVSNRYQHVTFRITHEGAFLVPIIDGKEKLDIFYSCY